jgi:glyoxylate/hydroxypyruvate reductase A
VINAGRGATMVEPDLLDAINAQQIAGAALDVFCEEPMPQDHPFWGHSKIDIWPHVAAQTNPDTATRQIVDNIRRLMAGEAPVNQVNFSRQY